MKRHLISLVCLAFLLVSSASSQQTETMRVNADRVNLRKAPSTDSAIVRAMAKGTLVTVMSRDGAWVKVQLQGLTTTGWVRSDLLVAVPATSAGAPAGQPQSAIAPPPPPPPPPPPAVTPPPPPGGRRTNPPPPPKAPAGPKDASYRGGPTFFGGITSFTVTITPAPGFTLSNASGFMAGAGLIGHLGGPIGLELDAAYVQKGAAGTTGGTTLTTRDNFAEGMVLLRPAFGSGPVRFFLLGGGEVGYQINCTYSLAANGACTIDSHVQSRVDYGVLLGGGVSFGPLAVQVRYDLGVANLSKATGTSVKNKGLMVLGSLIL